MTKTFSETRREPLLDQASFEWSVDFDLNQAIPGYEETLNHPETSAEGRGSMRWHISRVRIDHSILLYSGGRSLSDVRDAVRAALDSIDAHLEHEGAVFASVDLAIQEYYVEALWLLSLTKLLGLPESDIERVANFYAVDESNDGADELFELMLAKLGRNSFPAEGLIHDDPYQSLLDCINAEPARRPALMALFLQRWFEGQKECDWWGSHINRRGEAILKTGFVGYWAFEAALVTYLWGIDDSSYRDLPHYPKDLLDYARANAPRPLGGQSP
jgi:hypothetical protein